MIRNDSTNHDGSTNPSEERFQYRVLAMLEGAAFALLHDRIRELEHVARSNAISQFNDKVEKVKRDFEELARREEEVQTLIARSEKQARETEELNKRIRKRSKRIARSAELYKKTVEEIRERLDELVDSCDGTGIANELEAIIGLIEKAARRDPDFQAG